MDVTLGHIVAGVVHGTTMTRDFKGGTNKDAHICPLCKASRQRKRGSLLSVS